MTPTSLQTLMVAYGQLGGWMGMAFAVYLNRLRPEQATPVIQFGIFAMGFAMLSTTLLVADVVLGEATIMLVLFAAYTLLIMAELAMFGVDARLQLVTDIKRWLFNDPRFIVPSLPTDGDSDPADTETATDTDTECKCGCECECECETETEYAR